MTERTELARLDANESTPLKILDIYEGGLVEQDLSRVDALATISAGRRNEKGLPQAVREGDEKHIYLHDRTGRAPGLRAILETNEWKRLTIAFPYNNPNAFIQQHLALYSATELQIYGDERELTVIKDGRHTTYPAGSTEYKALIAKCKNTVSVYFAISLWDDDGSSRVIFPDGLGLYRLRFTSRNSLRNLDAEIKMVQKFTGNQIAGVPFDLAVDFREVAGPDGKKRTIPCWTFTMKPPPSAGMLTSRTFRPLMNSALAEGQALMLPVPSAETIESAQTDIIDIDLEDPTDAQAKLIAEGGACDKAHFTATWFATVRDTSLDSNDARRDFLLSYTNGECPSLRFFLEQATTEQASALIGAAISTLTKLGEIKPPPEIDSGAEYERLYGASYADVEPVTPQTPQVVDIPTQPEPPQVIDVGAPPEPPDDPEYIESLAADQDDAPPARQPQQKATKAPAGTVVLCADPECLEQGRPAKALEGTNPPRCFGHADVKEESLAT